MRKLALTLVPLLLLACDREPTAPTIAGGPTLNFSNNAVEQGALRPTMFKFHIDDPPGVVGNCETFDILEATVGDIIITVFHNQGGEPARMQIHWNLIHTWSNSATGQSISSSSVGNGVQDFATGTFGVAGAPFVLTIKGEGIVIKDAGLLVIDVDGNALFEAGTHDFGPNGDPTTLCPRLA
jgi:hypothetical protein